MVNNNLLADYFDEVFARACDARKAARRAHSGNKILLLLRWATLGRLDFDGGENRYFLAYHVGRDFDFSPADKVATANA